MAVTYVAPATLTGMGAIVQDGGVSFRVWAPNAQAVTLGGDFLNAGVTDPVNWQELPMAQDAANGEGAVGIWAWANKQEQVPPFEIGGRLHVPKKLLPCLQGNQLCS